LPIDRIRLSSETRQAEAFMTFEEIEERMNELGRKLAETRDKKIIKELYELALKLEKMRSSDDLFTAPRTPTAP
jgi:hypothetical protein